MPSKCMNGHRYTYMIINSALQLTESSIKKKKNGKNSKPSLSLWPMQNLVRSPGSFSDYQHDWTELVCSTYVLSTYSVFFFSKLSFFQGSNVWNMWPLNQDFPADCTLCPLNPISCDLLHRIKCLQPITSFILKSSDIEGPPPFFFLSA